MAALGPAPDVPPNHPTVVLTRSAGPLLSVVNHGDHRGRHSGPAAPDPPRSHTASRGQLMARNANSTNESLFTAASIGAGVHGFARALRGPDWQRGARWGAQVEGRTTAEDACIGHRLSRPFYHAQVDGGKPKQELARRRANDVGELTTCAVHWTRPASDPAGCRTCATDEQR